MAGSALTVDCYTRVPLGFCPSRDIDGEPYARIDDFFRVLPQYVAYARRQLAESRARSYRDLFSQKLLVSRGSAPFPLDPQDAPMFARQWQTFEGLLRCCGVKLLDGLEPAVPLISAVDTRFDYVCRIDPGPTLHVERTLLTTADENAKELFRALAGGGVPRRLAQVPRFLREQIRTELEGKLRTDVFDAPILPLLRRAREVMERTVVANHFLYAELIGDIIRHRAYDHENTIPDILTSHLQGRVSGRTREELQARIRGDFPGFEFPPSLAGVHFFEERPVPSPPHAIPPPPPPVPAAPPPEEPGPPVKHAGVTYHPMPYGDDLREILDYLDAQVHFHRWKVEGQIDHFGDAAGFLIGQVPDLQEGWDGGSPDPEPVAPDEFWEPFKASHSFSALRGALYSPPYFRAGPAQVARLEPRLFRILFGDSREDDFAVFRFETRGHPWFINEWWDYGWIAFNVKRGEAIAIYGTATD